MISKPNIFIISFTIPYPADDGGKIYLFGSIDYLRTYFNVTLLLNAYVQEDLNRIEDLKKVWKNVKVEVVYHNLFFENVPVSKFRRLITYLRKVRHGTVAKANDKGNETSIKLYNKDFLSISWTDEILINRINEILSKDIFSIIQVEHTKFLSLVTILPKDTVKVFVEIESKSSIYNDFKIIAAPEEIFYINYLAENAKHLELSYMKKYDAILALSQEDSTRLGNLLPGQRIYFNPYGVLEEHIRSLEESLTFNLDKILFMGSENHSPNVDAIEWFIYKVYDRIKKVKKICLYITGRWSEIFKQRFQEDEGIIFTGYLNDIKDVMTNSVAIVPIRLGGGGLRAKVIQALAFGVPVVSTSLGCEGIKVKDGESILIADSEDQFAESIIQVLNNELLAQSLIKHGKEVIDNNYSFKVIGEQRVQIYKQLIQQKNEKRS